MSPWGVVDLWSIVLGIVVLGLGLATSARYRAIDKAIVLLATGLSLGPLAFILFDPFWQLMALGGSLLDLVLKEGRTTLWLAAAVAALHLLRDGFR